MATEERVSRLEGAYEQVDRRLNDLSLSLEALRVELHNEANGLRAEVNSRFNNIYVLMGATWITTIGAIIGLYFK